jgi:tetratricopeptide (TPR) repeat protein
MQVLAVAGAPITQEVLAGAVGGDRAELERHVSLLRVEHLASITGGRAADTIEPYHDRVRAAVLTNTTSDARVACHRALALALEQAPRQEAEALARHWRGAGDPVQASRYSILAANEAAGALAFDRAVALYEAALDLGPSAGAERSALLEKLGDALANAGRGKRAAEAYAEASLGAHAARSLDLQRRAADQLLRTGHFDEGIDALERVLASIGLSWPRSPLFAVLFFLASRLYVRLRGLGFRPRDARDVAAPELARADIVWSVTFGIGFIDNVSGSAFQARHLILALRSGERARISRAIGVEACYSARRGAQASRQTEELVQRAHALATESENSHAIGWAHTASVVSYYLLGRYKQALEHVAHARTALANVPGSVWELDTATFFGTMCLVHLGKIGETAREVPAMVRDARRRGDLYAAVNLRLGFPNIAWLALDDGDGALAQINEALAEWSKRGFHLEHYYELIARTNALLYSGRAGDAHTLVTTRWPALSRSLLPFTIQSVRINSLHARARSAIAMAREGGDGLLREAAGAARRLERERAANGIGYAKLLRAGIAATRKESPERAISLLREAISTFDGAEMALYTAVARRCLGALLGGEEGRELVRVADAWMTSESIKSPARMTAMLAPGFGLN